MDRDSTRGEHSSHVGRRGRHPVDVLEKESGQYETDFAIGERQLLGHIRDAALRDVGVSSEFISRDIDSDETERVLGGQAINVRAVPTTAEIRHDTSFGEAGHFFLNSSKKFPL
jgi:hypothetical protein